MWPYWYWFYHSYFEDCVMEIVWYRVWSDILAVVSLNTSKAEKCEGCEVSSSLFMQHKWVTWLLQMFRCILSQFISLWDYCIAYLQQKYGHLSRMWQSRGFTSVQVSRAEGWSWERDPGVQSIRSPRLHQPGCLLLGGGAQLGVLHLAHLAQLEPWRLWWERATQLQV